ncbi:hypothetical protein M513_12720 [Trichuris suis]|uniref:Uncharacterized protein n=1 Tax=Trichuris suis TaxID=68888 RepID=A0A085LN71_9BILA|nr:hypothetical protein M513_12720 [Trichuris suis]
MTARCSSHSSPGSSIIRLSLMITYLTRVGSTVFIASAGHNSRRLPLIRTIFGEQVVRGRQRTGHNTDQSDSSHGNCPSINHGSR